MQDNGPMCNDRNSAYFGGPETNCNPTSPILLLYNFESGNEFRSIALNDPTKAYNALTFSKYVPPRSFNVIVTGLYVPDLFGVQLG